MTKYDVNAMPTFVFVKNGEVKDTIVGANKKKLEQNVEAFQWEGLLPFVKKGLESFATLLVLCVVAQHPPSQISISIITFWFLRILHPVKDARKITKTRRISGSEFLIRYFP